MLSSFYVFLPTYYPTIHLRSCCVLAYNILIINAIKLCFVKILGFSITLLRGGSASGFYNQEKKEGTELLLRGSK